MKYRDTNLDLLRATAILVVALYHIFERWPPQSEAFAAIAKYGAYGVDLFFVLSGWLIGGLLWREQKKFGNIEIGRFIGRRFLRIAPPYLAALIISYLGVFYFRNESFNFGYLFFIQNYYEKIPFFQISWSLCVEEHFYLTIPLLIFAINHFRIPPNFIFALAAITPCILRILNDYDGTPEPFGYNVTATHFRFEGLLLGVWAAYIRANNPLGWRTLQKISARSLIPLFSLVVAASFLPQKEKYVIFFLCISVLFTLLLVSVAEQKPIFRSNSKTVFWIATTSYSIYLTHAFTIDASLRFIKILPALDILHFSTIVFFIAIAGYGLHRLIELPSMRLRNHLVPERAVIAFEPNDMKCSQVRHPQVPR